MLTELLLLAAMALLIYLIWLLRRRRNAHAQARADFTQFMTVVNEWSEKFGDYQLTGQAIAALTDHNERLSMAEHTPSPTWIGSPSHQHYLAEYKQCLARHHALVTEDVGNEPASKQATDLELSIKELGSLIDRKND
jgi:hypothetical protein